jgi:hypothetical protein
MIEGIDVRKHGGSRSIAVAKIIVCNLPECYADLLTLFRAMTNVRAAQTVTAVTGMIFDQIAQISSKRRRASCKRFRG